MIDRGFDAMIPRAADKRKDEEFYYSITIPIFGKVLSLTVQVKPKE